MKIEEIESGDWFALFAPDGSIQGMTLAPDFPTCFAQIQMFYKAKMGQSYNSLLLKGFKIMPIKLTVKAK